MFSVSWLCSLFSLASCAVDLWLFRFCDREHEWRRFGVDDLRLGDGSWLVREEFGFKSARGSKQLELRVSTTECVEKGGGEVRKATACADPYAMNCLQVNRRASAYHLKWIICVIIHDITLDYITLACKRYPFRVKPPRPVHFVRETSYPGGWSNPREAWVE